MFWKKGICNYCHKETNDESFTCDSCYETKVKPNNKPVDSIGIVMIDLGEGIKASRARIDELDRRVVLPEKRPDGHPHIGRRDERGRITDRLPSY